MTGLSLFTGCGGLDLAAEMAGIEIAGQCEIDRACNRVLEKRWPKVPRWRDVRDVTAESVYARCGHVDLICAGFPCQPHSVAGSREGSGDERDMWPELCRVLCEIRPRWFVGENVRGLLSSEHGAFLGGVYRDLAALGYSVGWGVWGACDVGAPHKRERVFIVACHDHAGLQVAGYEPGEQAVYAEYGVEYGSFNLRPSPRANSGHGAGVHGDGGLDLQTAVANRATPRAGKTGGYSSPEFRPTLEQQVNWITPICTNAKNSTLPPSEAKRSSLVGNITADYRQADESIALNPDWVELLMGFPMGWTDATCDEPKPFPGWPAGRYSEQYDYEPPRVVPAGSAPGRTARLKMLGNAVVPQQAYVAFWAIMNSI